MPQEYTRQRQGRDFSSRNYLKNAEMSLEGNYNSIDGIINGSPKDDDAKKTLQDRLEQYKNTAERNTTPIDGHEPAQEHPAPEHGR